MLSERTKLQMHSDSIPTNQIAVIFYNVISVMEITIPFPNDHRPMAGCNLEILDVEKMSFGKTQTPKSTDR
jgi:hypothetical protein